MSVRFKKRKSIKEKPKNTKKETSNHIACLVKKLSAPSPATKDFMVKRPASDIGKIKKINSQSILLETFSTIF